MSTQDKYLVNVTVDGQPLGSGWTWAGGTPAPEIQKHPRAGGGDDTFPARVTYEDLTLSRVYMVPRDSSIRAFLKSRSGRGVVSASRTALDADEVPIPGTTETAVGRLGPVNPGDSDPAATDKKMVELVVVVESVS